MRPLKELIPEVLSKKLKFQKKFSVFLAKERLKEKFRINDLSFQKGILKINAEHPALLTDLSFKKEEIKKEAEKFLGKNSIKEIVFKRK